MTGVEFGVVGFEVGLGWVGCEPAGVGRRRVGFRSGWGGWVETDWGGLSQGGWGWGGWVMSRLGWVEIGVAGVETELGLVVAVGMVGCGDCDGGQWLLDQWRWWLDFSVFG